MTKAIVVRIEGDYVITAQGADLLSAIAGQASDAKDEAVAAAAVALAAAGVGEYADTGAGLSGTTEGETFWVDMGDGTGQVYRHDPGPTATPLQKFIIDPTDSGAADIFAGGVPTTAALESPAGADMVGVADGGDVQSRIDFYDDRAIYSKEVGVVGDGSVDDTLALQAAVTLAAAKRRELVIQGTPKVTSQIVVPNYSSISFAGARGNTTSRLPGSYIIKAASMTVPALLVSGDTVLLNGGGVVGQPGNVGDNIQITGHSARWYGGFSALAGRDGLRLGEDTAGAPNTNQYRLYDFTSFQNGRDGFHISDNLTPGGSSNANAGTLATCMSQFNGRYGVYGGNASMVTLIGMLIQQNMGVGIYLDRLSMGWQFLGGDSEHNKNSSNDIGSDLTIVATDLPCTLEASSDTIYSTAHGWADGEPVRFASLSSGTGLSLGTVYIIANASADSFQVALSATPTVPVDITGDGSGTFYRVNGHQSRGGHRIEGLHLGRYPIDLGFQTSRGWSIGLGWGTDSGFVPAYCEGVFTPTLSGSTTAGSSTLTGTSRWTKNGRHVTLFIDISVSAFSGAAGTMRIGNLPFSALAGTAASVSVGLQSYLVMPASRPNLGCALSGRNCDLYGYGGLNTTAFQAVDAASQTGNFASAGRLVIVVQYISAD